MQRLYTKTKPSQQTDKFKNKYRIPSARLLNWDYGLNGAYFITICTRDREHFFGEILDSAIPAMQLNRIGQLAEQYWLAIPAHFPFVELGNFVVMSNHVHGILIINKMIDALHVETLHVETLHATSLPKNDEPENAKTRNVEPENAELDNNNRNNTETTNTNKQMADISPKSGSISTIIRSYKSAVTKNARAIHADFDWQPVFTIILSAMPTLLKPFKIIFSAIQPTGSTINFISKSATSNIRRIRFDVTVKPGLRFSVDQR